MDRVALAAQDAVRLARSKSAWHAGQQAKWPNTSLHSASVSTPKAAAFERSRVLRQFMVNSFLSSLLHNTVAPGDV